MLAMARKRRFKAIAGIDPAELASFQTAIRKRYSDDQILAELRSSAERLGRSPTMKEFAADAGSRVHPDGDRHFGTWNAAKRAAGRPAPVVTRRLLEVTCVALRELGRAPAAPHIDERRGRMPSSRSTGTRRIAERAPRSGVHVAVGRSGWSGDRAGAVLRNLGHLPKSPMGGARAKASEPMLTQWQATACSITPWCLGHLQFRCAGGC